MINIFSQLRILSATILLIIVTAGCELAQVPQVSPTPASNSTETATPTVTLAQSVTLENVVTLRPQIESPSPTWTPGPPTFTYTPSSTPGPYEYTIQEGDTLLFIIQQPPFNYRDATVLNQILEMNPQIPNINVLPPPGSVILIPRQTLTPTPEGYQQTLAVMPAPTQPSIPNEIVQYTVNEGETIIGVAESNATTLSILATLNPSISFAGCDFSTPFGGSGCNVFLVAGQVVNVPALTPTPTLSPTFSGSETPTPTPTFMPPIPVFPPQNANAPARTFQLQWLSAGILQPEQFYVVQIEDTLTGETVTGVTRNTSFELPASMVPSDGQTHQMRWRVSIGVPNEQGAYRLISPDSPWNLFSWQSR